LMSPAVLDTAEMVLLPEVTMPYIALEPDPSMVVPAGIPVPVMGCPTRNPVMVDPVIVATALPEVRLPVREATKLDAVAFALIVRVLPRVLEPTAVMVVLAGMLVPVMI